MKKILITLLVTAFANSAMALSCHGTEPFWSAELTENTVSINLIEEPVIALPVTSIDGVAGYTSDFVKIYSNDNGPVAILTSNTCNDSMSDFEFAHEVILMTGSQKYYGCCGKPISGQD